MATVATLARSELSDKIDLESSLADSLRQYYADLVRKTIALYIKFQQILDPDELEDILTDILLGHYINIAEIFGDRISPELDDDVGVTPEERTLINEVSDLFVQSRAPMQTAIITVTDRNIILESFSAALESVDKGQLVDPAEIAIIAGVLMSSRFRARIGTISSVETQVVAENAKQNELEVLLGRLIAPSNRIIVDFPEIREWVTAGDEKVRAAHVAADNQLRPLGKPFLVGGQFLLYPGDTSLGATMDNIYRCRCSAVTRSEVVSNVRRMAA